MARPERGSDAGSGAIGRRGLLAIGYAALALRLVYLWVLWRDDLVTGLFLDSRFYADAAQAIRSGAGIGEHPYLLSPLYPYLLAAFPGIGEDAVTNPAWAPRLVQAFLGAGTCVLVASLGRRLGGRRVGLLAGWMAVFYGPLIHHDLALLVAGPQAFFLTLGVVLASIGPAAETRRRDLLRWGGVGLALGVGAALRPTVLIVAVAFFAALALGALRPRRAGLERAAALALGTALVVLPFTARNLVVTGQPVLLSANGGLNFWIGNHRGAPGVYDAPPGRVFDGNPLRIDHVREVLGPETTHVEASAYWWSEGWKEVRADPLAWVGLLGRKGLLFFHPQEIPQLGWSFQWYRERAWPLRFPLDGRWVLLLALAAPVLLLLRRERAELVDTRWVLLALGVYAAAIVLFFITGRYRLPIMPVALALAALTLVRLAESLFRRDAHFFPSVGILAGLLLAGGASLPFYRRFVHYPVETGIEEAHRAASLVDAGRLAEAADLYPRVLAIYDRVHARVTYAEALRGLGRTGEALEQYERVLAQDPENSVSWFNYGNLLWEDLRRAADAEAAFRRSLELRDDAGATHFNLGVVLLQERRFPEALASIEHALELAEEEEEWVPEAHRAARIARDRLLRGD